MKLVKRLATLLANFKHVAVKSLEVSNTYFHRLLSLRLKIQSDIKCNKSRPSLIEDFPYKQHVFCY